MPAMQPSIRSSLLLLSRTPQSTSSSRLLLPSTTSTLSPPPCQHSRRPFSHTPGHRIAMGTTQHVKPKVPPQKSMRSRMKSVPFSELPTDMGLLPGTFVRPGPENMPSLFQDPKTRWQMEWTYLKNWGQNFLGLLAYCKYLNKKIPLRLRERKRVALDLHRQMYNAFASGDQRTLHNVCCDGLFEDFNRRIMHRSTPRLSWTLHKYYRFLPTFSSAKILSDRAAPLPGMSGCGIRQVVVKIKSRQSIVKPTASSSTDQSEEAAAAVDVSKQKDVEENLVIQKVLWQGKETDWKVWGMANETTVEDLDSPFFAGELSISERLQMMKAQFEKK